MDIKELSVLSCGDGDGEHFALSNSSTADAAFDAVIGRIEDIIMEEEFQQLQQSFMDKHYMEFDDSEENKLSYTPIFNNYVDLLERHLEKQLMERIPGFNMAAFTRMLTQHKEEVPADIFDMLLSFTDFMAFKEMFLDYRAMKEGKGLDLGLVVTSLNCTGPVAILDPLEHCGRRGPTGARLVALHD